MTPVLTLIKREFVVQVPVKQAWSHLAQVMAWPSWARHIRSIEVEPVGGLCLRSKGRIHLRNGIRSEFRVVEFNPPLDWKWVGAFLWLTVHYNHRFEPDGLGRTKLTWIVDAEGLGVSFIGRLFAKIYRRSMERAIPHLTAEISKCST